MYFNPKKHLLSDTLLIVALLRLTGAALSGAVRFLIRKQSMMPDMKDSLIWYTQEISSAIVIIGSALIFIFVIRKVDRKIKVIPEDDRYEMARLQEEVYGKKNTMMPAEVVRKILILWSVILVSIQLMYEISSATYRKILLVLSEEYARENGMTGETYIGIYNLSHGFKYQGMMIALLLGVMVTAIFLDDKKMMFVTLFIAAGFMLSAAGIDMSSIRILGQDIGVVWSSAIFHFVETVGLITLAVYLRIRYSGV